MGILEKMKLDGKTAFVTGGARGIGKSIATALAEAGSNVVIIDIDIAEAEKTAELIAKTNNVKTLAIKAKIRITFFIAVVGFLNTVKLQKKHNQSIFPLKYF